MPVSLTDDEKLQLSLFKLMEQKAVSFLVEDSCNKQDISSTKNECILLAVRKMCQVYIDLQDSPSESKRLCALIISYLKIIYHSNMPKSIKTAILKFIKTPNIQGCQGSFLPDPQDRHHRTLLRPEVSGSIFQMERRIG